jgi:lysozyme
MTAQDLVKRFEGCKLLAYLDTGGIPTIGYGHTGPDVYLGLVWTQIQANAELIHDLHCAQTLLLSYSPSVASLPGPLAALTDFVFNLGVGNYRTSTLCRDVNAGNWVAAKQQILLWNHGRVHGQLVVLPGLQARRLAESELLAA